MHHLGCFRFEIDGHQSGVESRMSSLIVPLNRGAMPTTVFDRDAARTCAFGTVRG